MFLLLVQKNIFKSFFFWCHLKHFFEISGIPGLLRNAVDLKIVNNKKSYIIKFLVLRHF